MKARAPYLKRPMWRMKTSLILSLAVTVLLAGCVEPFTGHHDDGHMGDGHHHGTGATGEGNRPVTGTEDVEWLVAAGTPEEFRFTPATLEAAEGQTVAVTFTNEGDAPHEFSFEAAAFHLHAEPGETLQGAFVAPAAGTYEFACYIPGNYESGMKGLVVISD